MAGKRNKALAGVAVLWIVLMVIFSFQDLSMSKSVYREGTAFGHFFEAFGHHPAFLAVFAAASVLFRTADIRTGRSRTVMRAITGCLMLVSGFVSFYYTLKYGAGQEGLGGKAASLVLAALLAIAGQLLLKRMPAARLASYNRAAAAVVLIVLAELIAVQVLKLAWGRMRFREMHGDYSGFTSWFIPQGISGGGDGFKSFPSGHSADGWAMLVWMLLVPFKRVWRAGMLALAVAWGLCTSYSRIVEGAHFASDVTMGAFITIGCTLLICGWLNMELFPSASRRLRSKITMSS